MMIPGSVIHTRLTDPNQIARLSQWELDFRQVEPGLMRTDVAINKGRSLELLRIRMSRAVHQRGSAPLQRVTFGIPTWSALDNWKGVEPPSAVVVGFGAGAEFDGVGRPGFDALTLSFDKEAFIGLADRLGIAVEKTVFEAALHSAMARPELIGKLLSHANNFLNSAAPALSEAEEEAITAELLCTLTASEQHLDQSSVRKRDRALDRALEYISQHGSENLKIGELCVLSGASWRTLERAFNERFGVGPKAYAKYVRLQRMRAELLAAPPGTPINSVANRWGFWHMGELARDYRLLFGRLPSEERMR
jgi:AraC-like DNA-binding protein